MAIIMGKSCIEAIYGLMGWKGLKLNSSDGSVGQGVVNVIGHWS